MIGAMGYLTYSAYHNHDPYDLFRGVDNTGKICGSKTEATTKDLPLLYFYNPFTGTLKATKICVSACPTWDGTIVTVPTSTAALTWAHEYKSDGTQVTVATVNPTDFVGYDSYSLIGRVCIPNKNLFSDLLIAASQFSSAFSQSDVANLISDIMNNWQYLLAALGFAIVISFVFMFLLRCIAGCVVWCSLFGIILFFIGIGLLFLYSAGTIGGSHANTVVTTLGVPTASSSGNNNVYGWVSIGIVEGGQTHAIVGRSCCSIAMAMGVFFNLG